MAMSFCAGLEPWPGPSLVHYRPDALSPALRRIQLRDPGRWSKLIYDL